VNYGRRYGETWRRSEGMPWIVGGSGGGGRWRRAVEAETLIPGYIHGVTEPRFFGLNDFDSDSVRRNEINRVPFVLLTIVVYDVRRT